MNSHTNLEAPEVTNPHCACSLEPMLKPDHKAKRHSRPSPKVIRRQKWHKPRRVAVDHELVLLEISAMQRAAGAL